MTQDKSKQFEVKLDHEGKVIRLGSYFYDLKGVLICEATEEDKKKYYCGRFMTFPIVDDDWKVREDLCLCDGIQNFIIGKKGDTLLLESLRSAIDHNASAYDCGYDELLVGLELHDITISSRKKLDSMEELSDTIVLSIDKLWKDRNIYRVDTWDGYYVPQRFCVVGEDGELYHQYASDKGDVINKNRTLAELIADDVVSLSWFFNKPNLRVLVVAPSGKYDGKVKPIPKDWYYTVQTLENDINRKIEEYLKEETRYYAAKRPDKFKA